MPYIPKVRRRDIEDQMFVGFPVLENAGELNYIISQLCINFVKDNGLRYQTLNDVVGALEGAKTEFQRRLVAPYEDEKIEENGDLDWGDLL